MLSIASLIARIRPWLLFVLIAVPFCAIPFFYTIPRISAGASLEEHLTTIQGAMLLSFPLVVLLYGWIWTICVVANSALHENVQRPFRLARWGMPFAILYIALIISILPRIATVDPFPAARGVFILLHLAATFYVFYAVVFAARSLASLGNTQFAGFGRIFLFFLAIIYFPVGLWWIQPRLNSISGQSQMDANNALH